MRIALAAVSALAILMLAAESRPSEAAWRMVDDAGGVVLVDDRGVARLLDTRTGDDKAHVGTRDAWVQAIATEDGTLLVSVAAADGTGTDLFGFRELDGNPESIGHYPGLATLMGVDTRSGDLFLVEWPRSADAPRQPSGLVRLPTPEAWPAATVAADSHRDMGAGVLSGDGSWWIGRSGSGFGVVEFHRDDKPSRSEIPIPTRASYYSLLLGPDQDTAILVDYYTQVIHEIDVSERVVNKSIPLQLAMTKQRGCAAVLSPDGDRLYVAERDGNTADGIYVFDTNTWQVVAHFLPDEATDLTCLVLAPDGRVIHATPRGSSEIIRLDTATGEFLGSASTLPIEDPIPVLAMDDQTQ